MTITQRAPKQFRFTLVSKIQTYSLNTIEYLYRANDIYVKRGDSKAYNRRREYQQQAMTECRLLAYMAQLSMEQKAILPKHYEHITDITHEIMNLLGAWIKSDEKRFDQNNSERHG
jgi:hypothetical protein